MIKFGCYIDNDYLEMILTPELQTSMYLCEPALPVPLKAIHPAINQTLCEAISDKSSNIHTFVFLIVVEGFLP